MVGQWAAKEKGDPLKIQSAEGPPEGTEVLGMLPDHFGPPSQKGGRGPAPP